MCAFNFQIARRLKLQNLPECYEMSGGQAVDFMANGGDPNAYAFPNSLTQYRDCNFAFSGYASFATSTIEEEEEKFGAYLIRIYISIVILNAIILCITYFIKNVLKNQCCD